MGGDRVTAATQTPTLSEAYQECRAFTKRRASNFYYAFASLPGDKRQAIYTAYAFAGSVDDAVDEAGSDEQRRDRLAQARVTLEQAYEGRGEDWLSLALGDVVARYAIPREYFDELVAGMEQDLSQPRYATFAELEQYCYRAASVIGLITIEIFGYDRERRDLAIEAAVDMGKALQLTNILRDVREDAERDRIYLAGEDLEAFGYSEADVKASVYNDAFRSLMAEYARRAEAYYESGLRLIPLLDGPRSRMCCNGLQGVYHSILASIVKRDYDVFSERVSPSKTGRLLLLFRLWATGAWPKRLAN